MDKINVQLYGGKGIFGGKETALQADEIYCDKYMNCSFYKKNKCLNCRTMFGQDCKFGKVQTTKGYTSRAAKYYDFKKRYTSDPVYDKLSYPNDLFGIVDNTFFFNTKYFTVRKRKESDEKYLKDVNGYIITDDSFFISSSVSWIPKEDITNDLLHYIFSYKPHTFFEHKYISEYQNKMVPEIVNGMKLLCEDIWSNLIAEYPEYSKQMDYTGKEIYLNSLTKGSEFTYKGKTWKYDGEYITTENFDLGLSSPWWSKQNYAEEIKIKVNDKMTIKVTDNSQVTPFTKFVD